MIKFDKKQHTAERYGRTINTSKLINWRPTMTNHCHPDGNRFAVVTATASGPMVSYWPRAETVIRLLTTYCNNEFGTTVSVWHRRTARSAKWEPMLII